MRAALIPLAYARCANAVEGVSPIAAVRSIEEVSQLKEKRERVIGLALVVC
jgi:hypothetical protein